MLFTTGVFYCVVFLSMCQTVWIDNAGQKGRLEIAVFDSYGHSLSGADVRIEQCGESVRHDMRQFAPGMALDYGRYNIEVSASGFSPHEAAVEVENAFQILVVGLRPAEIEGRAIYSLRGRLAEPQQYPGCRIVRLVPLLSRIVRLVPLLSPGRPIDAVVFEGRFVLEGIWPGRYTALVLGPKGICAVSDVAIPLSPSPSQEITIIGGR